MITSEDRRRKLNEKRIYDLLETKLPDSYTVIWRVPWLAKWRTEEARDGEADFVVVHPKHGILIIEVKGGKIRRNPRTGKWTSTDSSGVEYNIAPFDQVMKNVHGLRKKLKESPVTAIHNYPIARAVWFPTLFVDGLDLGLDAPRDIILDAHDFADPQASILRAFDYCLDQHRPPLSQSAIDAFIQLLAPPSEIRTSLGAQIVGETADMHRLTDEQFTVLDGLASRRRALISGIAGSGKTMLAIEKARRLANEGYRVLLTCYNEHLARHLFALLKNDVRRVEVYHFHEICSWYAKMAKITTTRRVGEDYFNDSLPNALAKAVATVHKRYDAIVVDEGQLFHKSWWMPLQFLLDDINDGIMYVFYDSNQKLYAGKDCALPEFDTSPYQLSVNCRNTQAIHRAFRQYYREDRQIVCKGAEGREVETHTVERTPEAARAKLRRILHHLVNEEKVPLQDIVILTPIVNGSMWEEGMGMGNLTISRTTSQPYPNTVFCSTIKGFVGLERAVVILTELDRIWGEPEPELYVAMSRATSHLIILQQE